MFDLIAFRYIFACDGNIVFFGFIYLFFVYSIELNIDLCNKKYFIYLLMIMFIFFGSFIFFIDFCIIFTTSFSSFVATIFFVCIVMCVVFIVYIFFVFVCVVYIVSILDFVFMFSIIFFLNEFGFNCIASLYVVI